MNPDSLVLNSVISKPTVYLLFFLILIVYVTGLFVKVMDVDAAQYASISREMLRNHEYLKVLDHGRNYLDKPPLLFWLSVVSFKLFGVSTFTYKLPSFLFTLLGIYATYRLAKYLYDEQTGLIAALMLFTCQAFFLINNDVRTDTLLTAFVVFSCWQLVLFSDSKKFTHLLAGFAGVSLALLSKGPIGAVVPASALFVHYLMKREWGKFFRWEWIAGIAIVFFLLLPMFIGLYEQYGKKGPEFFLWTQSFGRITGENPWHNDAGYFYFLHVFLWSFLPWSLLVAAAFIFFLVKIFRKRFHQNALTEYYTIGGFLLPFIALSTSHYKLPHYIFVLYPLAAIFTAAFISRVLVFPKKVITGFRIIQLIISLGMFTLVLIICTLWFPMSNIALWVLAIAGIIAGIWSWLKPFNTISGIIFPSVIAAITVNLLLDAHAYPQLLKYQSGSEIAAIANRQSLQNDTIYTYNYYNNSLDFYSKSPVAPLSAHDVISMMNQQKHFSVIGGEDLSRVITEKNLKPKQVYATDEYHITTLTTRFLNRSTRGSTLSRVYLVEF